MLTCAIDGVEINGAEIDGCLNGIMVEMACTRSADVCRLMTEVITETIASEKVCVPSEDRLVTVGEESATVIKPKGNEKCT